MVSRRPSVSILARVARRVFCNGIALALICRYYRYRCKLLAAMSQHPPVLQTVGRSCSMNTEYSADRLEHIRLHNSHKDIVAHFWGKVQTGDTATCWPFAGGRFTQGYGAITFKWPGYANGRAFRAHRFAYLATHKEIPNGLHVLHTCDNRPCCNPAHLYPGSDADNKADMYRRKRNAQTGRKLSTNMVQAMRARYLAGGVTQRELADEYGIRHRAAHYILKNRTHADDGHVGATLEGRDRRKRQAEPHPSGVGGQA